ncbi:MAG: hypothetical protein ACYCSF_02340 [Acidimicrobiales bacterium]
MAVVGVLLAVVPGVVEPVTPADVDGGAVGVVWGARPLGSAMRKSEIAFAEVGFGIVAPLGKNASVISCPSLNRRAEAFLVRILPDFAKGDFHTSVSANPGLPSHVRPFS